MNYWTAFLCGISFSVCSAQTPAESKHASTDGPSSDTSQQCPTQTSDSSRAYPEGLSTTFGRTLYYSSLSAYSTPEYEFLAGLGYNISPQFAVCVNIYTGNEYADNAKVEPIAGKFAFGGGGLEVIRRFGSNTSFRPVISVAYELSTILTSGASSGVNSTGSGYNGRAFSIRIGGEYYLSRNVSFALNAVEKYRQYTDLILAGDFKGNASVGIDHVIGVTISGSIHYNFLP